MRKRFLTLVLAASVIAAFGGTALAGERRHGGGHDRPGQHWKDRGDHERGGPDRGRHDRWDHDRWGGDWRDRGGHHRSGRDWKDRAERFKRGHERHASPPWHAPSRKPWHRGFERAHRGPVAVVPWHRARITVVPPHRWRHDRPDFVVLPTDRRSFYFDCVRRHGYRPVHEVRRTSAIIVIRASDGFGAAFDLVLDSRSGSLLGRSPHRP